MSAYRGQIAVPVRVPYPHSVPQFRSLNGWFAERRALLLGSCIVYERVASGLRRSNASIAHGRPAIGAMTAQGITVEGQGTESPAPFAAIAVASSSPHATDACG